MSCTRPIGVQLRCGLTCVLVRYRPPGQMVGRILKMVAVGEVSCHPTASKPGDSLTSSTRTVAGCPTALGGCSSWRTQRNASCRNAHHISALTAPSHRPSTLAFLAVMAAVAAAPNDAPANLELILPGSWRLHPFMWNVEHRLLPRPFCVVPNDRWQPLCRKAMSRPWRPHQLRW